ncbi:MAG: TrkH family potassium uptake protein [Gammaproteobacteria bacterium]|nr:TrkH family potassium uptake protein [Gammaproteobacteria bacterium]
MNIGIVQRILGILLMIFSISMLPPIMVSWYYADGSMLPFVYGFLVTASVGIIAWYPVRKKQRDLRLREGFFVVAMFWAVLGSFGAVPLLFAEQPDLSFTNAVFESMSGLTTTGATVLTGLDDLPRSILYYRQQLQWLGGMGIIVLAVAILPMLGVGGMQLYRAETPGPIKDNKLTPRITETAKALWYIYLGLTVACALAYLLAGMDLFDAVSHAFSTVAIGGFSTHDMSIGYFQSAAIELVAVVFMLLSGVNFSLHYLAWRYGSIKPYLSDPEFKAYIKVLFALTAATSVYLYFIGAYDNVGSSFIKGLFQVVSIGTTTGFTTADYAHWPGFLPVLLIFASFMGACAGSTGGGMKVIRFLLLYKQGMREIIRLVHPNAEFPVKMGKKAVSSRVVESVWGFFSAYMVVFGVMMLILMATGIDQVTAFSAVAACLNNLGPGLGDVAANFNSLNDVAKWVLVVAMLLGRLEIFTLLVLFTPAFWQR